MRNGPDRYLIFAKRVLILFLVIGCGATVWAAGRGESEAAAESEVVIEFPHYRTGPSGEGVTFGAQVARFNEEFAGVYRIVLEEIPGEQYNDKIKLLYQNDMLPPLFETNNSDTEWTRTLIEGNTWVDLAPYIDADPVFERVMMEQSIAFNRTEGGAIPSLPYAYVKYAYMYYNKEIFNNAGVTEVPDDWSSFVSACERIKASGVTPISFMTGENAWTTMLVTYAYFAATAEGKALLEAGEMQYDFTTGVWIDTITKVTELIQNYGSSAALGAKYPDAANAFFTEQAAIIPQGSWFVPDLSNPNQVDEGFDAKIGVAAFPGGIVLGDSNGYGMMINREAPETVKEGLIEFFKFMYRPSEINEWLVAVPGFAPNVEMTAEYTSRLTGPATELSQVEATPWARFETIVPNAVLGLFPRNLPLLMSGDMTPEEMAAEMTSTAQKFR